MATPSPSPSIPPSSTPADSDTGGDDDVPEGSVDGLPADDGNTPDQPLTINPQMAAAAGLTDLQVGDSFAVTIHGTVTDNTDGAITADIEDAMDGTKTPGDADLPPPKKKGMSNVISPRDAGFSADGMDTIPS